MIDHGLYQEPVQLQKQFIFFDAEEYHTSLLFGGAEEIKALELKLKILTIK